MQEVLPALQPLRARFIEMSAYRSAELSNLKRRINLEGDPNAAMCEIGDIVHKISGVAATLGFPEWGLLAAELDGITNALQKQEISADEAWRRAEPSLDQLIYSMATP
ncbi:Hpt domain-containing protein [Pseudorhodobacter antarcticus]|uniref:Hpt domain-containing protein n=1 Tax=Pseudorhodobacter antarcticus TaxID=1077947 RepID=A0A1H8NVE5_9RHOB|nr:Hpt domain-containing protein [Pseudorhodobacter antarcticus]SEO33599.1 Hpt domain-containing protein [Pseudorhodobacter antarcticus]